MNDKLDNEQSSAQSPNVVLAREVQYRYSDFKCQRGVDISLW